jgi:DNA polymerase-3 subunit gamma/tau
MEALEGHLRWIATEEAIGITPEALHLVAQRAQGGLRDAESLLDQLSLLPAPIAPAAVWDLLGAVPEEELLQLAEAMAAADPLQVVEGCRELLDRGREPSAVLQGLASLLRDLLLAGVAPDRLELTSVSPELRPRLPEVARRIGKARLLEWQAQLKGSEQQLRHSVQPRLWLEVLVLGLLAEPAAIVSSATGPGPVGAAVRPVVPRGEPTLAAPVAALAVRATEPKAPDTPSAAPEAAPAPENLTELWQQILARLELPSTRMLLSQQAQLLRLDERRAVVRVAGTWMAMVQSRLPLLEKAVASALGSPRQLSLEAGGDGSPATGTESPHAVLAVAKPPAAHAPSGRPEPAQPNGTASIHRPEPRTDPADKPPPASETAEVSGSTPVRRTPADPNSLDQPDASPTAQMAPKMSDRLDAQAKRLADFFNGEVVADCGSEML